MFFILFKSKCITKVIINIVSFVLLVDDDIWVDVVFLKLQVYELTNKFNEYYNIIIY